MANPAAEFFAETVDSATVQTLLDTYGPTFLVLGALGFLYFKAQNSPSTTASAAILNGAVGSLGDVLELAQDAFAMAKAAHDELQEVRRSANTCEKRNAALVRHNLMLTNQLVEAGIVPVPMPGGTLQEED